jgi:hypothetical protein
MKNIGSNLPINICGGITDTVNVNDAINGQINEHHNFTPGGGMAGWVISPGNAEFNMFLDGRQIGRALSPVQYSLNNTYERAQGMVLA